MRTSNIVHAIANLTSLTITIIRFVYIIGVCPGYRDCLLIEQQALRPRNYSDMSNIDDKNFDDTAQKFGW